MARSCCLILSSAALIVAVPAAALPADSAVAALSKPEEAAPPELEQRVESLLDELDADTLRRRRAAEHELLELGPDVLPHLPPPELLPNASVREAVRRIRLTLEARQARDSVKASRVTLRGAIPLAEALQAVADQTGNPLHLDALPRAAKEREIRVDFDRRTFWEALDEITARAGLRYAAPPAVAADAERGDGLHESGSTGLRLLPRGGEEPAEAAVGYAGAFRFVVRSAERRRAAVEGQPHLVRLRMEVMAEPRLRPLFLRYAEKDFVVRARDGDVLPPFSPEASLERPLTDASRRATFLLIVECPPSVDASAVSLTGAVTVTTAAGAEEIAFTDLGDARGTSRRRGGVTVALRDVGFAAVPEHDDRQEARVRVSISYDAGGSAFESHRTWIFHNRAWLETPEGLRIERNSRFQTLAQADGAVAVEYHFGLRDIEGMHDELQDLRFVYEAPTLIEDVELELEMPDIPISG